MFAELVQDNYANSTDGRHRAKTKMFLWFLRESMESLSLVRLWLSPPDFPEKNGVSAGLGTANRGFCKGGLRLGTF
jgi:hypothetical protein